MTTDRRLNWCGISTETIAAEYETDAALAEAGMDMGDPYFLAAFAAEQEQRTLDVQAAPERPSGGTSGGGRSSSSRGGSSSSSSKHRPAHKGTSSSGGSGGVHVDIDHDCDDD